MDIEEQVIDIDGSCRDVNFPDVERAEVITFLDYINELSALDNAYDSEGNELTISKLKETISSSKSETIFSYWHCKGLISQIQIFFSWKNNSKIFIEITFFPQDIDSTLYSLEKFKSWLKPILLALNVRIYFVRYENASWKFGDMSETSGVIFSYKQYDINR